MAHQQRGLSEHHERFHAHYVRDTRTVSVRMADFLKNPHYVGCLLLVFAVTTYFMSYFADVIGILGIVSFLICFYQKSKLPFRLPMHSGMKDYNDVTPGKKEKARDARGIYYFGNETRTNNELWFSNEDMRTHVLIFGSTGSGKTEAMLSLAYNALCQASGFIYVDGKGDNALYAKVFSMARSMGREDDLLLINFMTGARDIIGPQETKLSNTLNPFATGSSSMLAQLVVGLMDKSAATPDGDMWKGRAIGFVEALMKLLVAMRDAGYILLDANVVRQYFLLSKLEAIVCDRLFLRDGQEAVDLRNLPISILEPIDSYMDNLPGYNKQKKGKQVSQVLEQHGFITMQLTRVFTSLADTYGHIMRHKLAEVDMKDVVLNRRILCVLLPALEKSPDELANLGKVIIATLKGMMASGLGDRVEGDYADLITSKPTNARTPYLCVLDEYGYYAVEGFAVVPAQARSLGFSVIFAGQDLPAFQKAKKEEAMSIGANTNIKICMKLEDPTETWDFFMKSAGESYVTHVDNFQIDQGSVLGTYADGKGARVEKRARIDLLDLKEQGLGEAHFLFKSKIVRGKFFYAEPKAVKKMRLNHFLKIDHPTDADAGKLTKCFDQFKQISTQGVNFSNSAVNSEELKSVMDIIEEEHALKPMERAAKALRRYYQQTELTSIFFESEEPTVDFLNLFTPMLNNDELSKVVLNDGDKERFEKPLLKRADIRDQVEYVERLCGKPSQQAMNVAVELVRDMEKGTEYPPKNKPTKNGPELAKLIHNMSDEIKLKMDESEKD